MDGSPWGGRRPRQAHPAPEARHALADGLPGALADALLTAHVADCAACRAELEQARHVAAHLSVLAPPPGDLLARVRTRRAAGERVLLPSVGGDEAWHPLAEVLDQHADCSDDDDDAEDVAAHVADCAVCGAVVERTRRVTAVLSVASAPPPDLLARVRARRAAGERVILPAVMDAADARADTPVDVSADEGARPVAARPLDVRPLSVRRRAAALGRWRVASLGAVAALLLITVRFGPGWRPNAGVGDERAATAPGSTEPRPTPIAGPPAPSPEPLVGSAPAPTSPAAVRGPEPLRPAPPRAPDRLRSAVVDDGTPATPDAPSIEVTVREASNSPMSPAVRVRATDGGLSVALAGVPAERLAPAQVEALDSVARVLAAHAERRATVRYTDPAFAHASASWAVARRVSDHLLLRGIAESRVTLVRVAVLGGFGGPAPADAVEVVIVEPTASGE